MPSRSQLGHGLAKGLGIKLDYRNEIQQEKLSRGESVFSVTSADTYVEQEPTVAEYFKEITPTPTDMKNYVYGLFPFVHWIGKYNVQWLIGDLVAGMLWNLLLIQSCCVW